MATGSAPISVVHVIDSLEIGGAEQALHLLVRHLDPARFGCRVYPLRGLGPLASDLERRGMLVNAPTGAGLPAKLWALGRFLATEQPAIVHTHLNYSDLFGGPIARAAGVPIVLSYKASILRSHGGRQRIYDALTRIASRADDAVVVLSGALRDYLLAHAIVPARKIRVVHYGVELGGETTAATRDALEVGAGPLVLLPARLEPRKDHATFFEAARRVQAELPATSFLLAGDGDSQYRAHLERLAAPLGNAVRFLGSRRDIPALMGLSDLVVLSSRTEGLGLVLLEAMAQRRPVAATRVGGIPEIVVEGETGLLVEAGDADALARAMIGLLRDPARAAGMGEAGRRRVEEHFSAERMARNMAAVYDELLARRAPHGTAP